MKHICILDACTIINLLHIDDDSNFLLKKIEKLELKLAEEVVNEVKVNYSKKFDALDNHNQTCSKSHIINYDKKFELNKIEKNLPLFISRQVCNSEIEKDVDIEKIREFTNYSKKQNGELMSTCLALSLSRTENSQLYFYTDDNGAKADFQLYFDFQQIGHIKDSVDLLFFLAWTNSDFSNN